MEKNYIKRASAALCLVFVGLIGIHQSVSAQAGWNMTLLGQWDDNLIPTISGAQYNDVWGYAAGGREYAIIGATDGNYIIEVTNPATPVVRAVLTGSCPSTRWRDHVTYQNYLYTVSDNCASGGLQIWDLSTLPAAPVLVYNSTALFSSAHTLTVNPVSGRIYVGGSNIQPAGIQILRVLGQPTAPTQLANFTLGSYTHDTYCHKDTLYAFYGNSGWASFNLVNLSAPAQLDYFWGYPDNGFAHSGTSINNNKTFIWSDETIGKNVKVADVSDPRNVIFSTMFKSALLGPTYTNSTAHNITAKGNLAFIAYYEDGLQVYDFTNPSAPVKVAYYDTQVNSTYNFTVGVWGVYTELPSGKILVSDTQNGLYILQLTTPFPVNLLNFGATALQDRVKLDWSTANELNNMSFTVERSIDGEHFEDLMEVAGAGTSADRKDYTADDQQPLSGISYYRLRQTDDNGATTLSNVVSVNFKNAAPEMSAFPDPGQVGEAITVQFSVQEALSGKLSVYDMVGKELHAEPLSLTPGQVEVKLPTTRWSAGTYLVRLDAGTFHLQQRFILTN